MSIFYLFIESNLAAYGWYEYNKTVTIAITMIAVLCIIATLINTHLKQ